MDEKEIAAAAAAALKDPQIGRVIADSVDRAVREQLDAAVPALVKGAVLGTQAAAERRAHDPYRTTIHFLAGLIAFCLAVIVGVFSALPDPPVSPAPLVHRLLGGVLAWIAVAALVATACAAVAQYRKHLYRARQDSTPSPETPRKWPLTLMLLPVAPGAMAVAYCVGSGLAMLNDNLAPATAAAAARLLLWPF